LDRWLTKEKVYVFDLDGVLIDVNFKIKIVLEKLGFDENTNPRSLNVVDRQKFWKLFLSEEYIKYDKPRAIGINLLKDRLDKGRIVVVTGRPETLRRKTLEELSKWSIPVNRLIFIFRRRGDRRRDVDFKVDVNAKLGNIVEVHDDTEEILEKIKEFFPNTSLYLHFNDEYAEY